MLISGVLGDSAVAVGFLAGIPLFIASVWAGIATGVKRLHDREKSGAWLLLFYLVPGVLQAIGDSGGGLFFVLIGFVISIWGFVEMGCLKGTTGPNEYGADPIPDEAVPQAGTGP
jgi:uncharacterized membrane protein YhaH (DUF805 family)